MSEDERKQLYWSMLRGIAKVAQDRMCAADRQHDWSDWHRYQVQHDDVPLSFEPGPIQNRAVHIQAQRRCLNCGKEEIA